MQLRTALRLHFGSFFVGYKHLDKQLVMDPENSTSSDLKAAILADSQLFLVSLGAGASEERLNILLDRIKEQEVRLMAEHGLRLSPEVWKILRSRLANRNSIEIMDTDPGDIFPQRPE